jgi:CRP/FNR family transcriptional regulator
MAPQRLTATDRERLLRVYPVLGTLPAALLRRIGESTKIVQLPEGQRAFEDGDPCTSHPWLVEGTLRVSKSGPAGDEILLYHVPAGGVCVLTVMALLGKAPHAATGTAETDSLVYAIPRDLFLALVLESEAFRISVFSALSHRMAELMALVDDLAFRGVAQRLAARLLQHAQPIEATHQALADELGTRREVVSRILGTLQRAGLIRLGRKRIEILDAPALDALHRV